MYGHLAADESIPWDRMHLFLGDERFVPADHEESNAKMVREALVSAVSVPEANVHLMDTHFHSPEEAALAYEDLLRAFFGGEPRFDAVLLGMGADAHTLSIFPDTRKLAADRLVEPVLAPPSYPTQERITLTMHAAGTSRWTAFLVTGPDKAAAIASIHGSGADREAVPAGRITSRGALRWYLDEAAASKLVPDQERGGSAGNGPNRA